MGLISKLLTGGVLVGKVCQMLVKSMSSAYVDEETGSIVAVSSINVSGVTFFQSNAGNSGMESYAANTDNNCTVSVVFPNDESGNGIAYDIKGIGKAMISPDLRTSQSPDKEILVGVTSSGANSESPVGEPNYPIVKLSLNNMKVGGDPISISDYQISAKPEGLVVKSDSRTLGSVVHLNLTSNSGILVNCQSEITAEKNKKTYSYDINLTSLGLRNNDLLSGQIHIEMPDSSLTAFSSSLSEPLHEAEERCFRKMGILNG